MSLRVKAKIGFIGSSAPSSPHHENFKAFIPKEIDITFVQEEGAANHFTMPEVKSKFWLARPWGSVKSIDGMG